MLTGHTAYSEFKHSLKFRVRRYVVIATKPVHRLQIHPIVHNYKAPLPFLQLTPGSVQLCENAARDRHTGRHTDTQTAVIKIHFASATLHAKCNK